MNIAGLLVDGVVAVLLIVAIVYCQLLSRRLKALHTGQDGLRDVIAALDRATERAQMSLMELKTLGGSMADGLKEERDKASVLLDELKLMVGSADRVANRLAETRPQTPAPSTELRRPVIAKDTPQADIYQALRQAR
jgi:Domain of unknown function (DUF6468)